MHIRTIPPHYCAKQHSEPLHHLRHRFKTPLWPLTFILFSFTSFRTVTSSITLLIVVYSFCNIRAPLQYHRSTSLSHPLSHASPHCLIAHLRIASIHHATASSHTPPHTSPFCSHIHYTAPYCLALLASSHCYHHHRTGLLVYSYTIVVDIKSPHRTLLPRLTPYCTPPHRIALNHINKHLRSVTSPTSTSLPLLLSTSISPLH